MKPLSSVMPKFVASAVLATAVIAGGALFPSESQAVTITNGSFESGIIPASTPGFTTLSAGDSTSITGWTVLSGTVDYIGTYWQAADGQRSLDLNGLSAGSIGQLLTGLTVGQKYTVTFDLAGNTDAGPATKTLNVTAAVGTTGYSFSTIGHSLTNMGWTLESFVFTADGTSDLLTFASTVTSGGTDANPAAFGPALDNVSISATPLPAALPLFATGLGLVGFLARRRKKQMASAAMVAA